jgi:hypothetical protein
VFIYKKPNCSIHIYISAIITMNGRDSSSFSSTRGNNFPDGDEDYDPNDEDDPIDEDEDGTTRTHATHAAHAAGAALPSLLLQHRENERDLIPSNTKKALDPFEHEYKDFLSCGIEGGTPTLDNAYRFLLYHAYRRTRAGRRGMKGCFDPEDYKQVMNEKVVACHPKGVGCDDGGPGMKQPFIMSQGHMKKIRQAVVNVACEMLPVEQSNLFRHCKKILGLINYQSKLRHRHNRANFREKGKGRVHSLKALEISRRVEEHLWHMMRNKAPHDLCVYLRHRFNFLTTCQSLKRNDSMHTVELSDIMLHSWKCEEEPHEYKVITLSNYSKARRDTGRPENMATLRAKDPTRCQHAAMAFYFYVRFEITREYEAFDFTKNESWYDNKLLVAVGNRNKGEKDCLTKAVSGKVYYSLLKGICQPLGVDFQHYEHFGRVYGVAQLEMAGVSVSARKGHGNWETGVMEKNYSSGIEIEACRGAAGFSPTMAGAHYNPRAQITPPDDLISTIWPWIEEKEMLLKQHPEFSERQAALEFIHTLKYLRTVLLQDAAWFYTRGRGNHAFFLLPLFQGPGFLSWASKFDSELSRLEEDTDNDPMHVMVRRVIPQVGNQLQELTVLSKAHRDEHNTHVKSSMDMMASMAQHVSQLLCYQQYQANIQASMNSIQNSFPPFNPMMQYSWPMFACHAWQTSPNLDPRVQPTMSPLERTALPEFPQGGIAAADALSTLMPPKQDKLKRQHCNTLEVMADYLGLSGSVLHGHGGYKALWVVPTTRNRMWYSQLDGSAQKYVRRVCHVGKIIDDAFSQRSHSLEDFCSMLDNNCIISHKKKNRSALHSLRHWLRKIIGLMVYNSILVLSIYLFM